jgi:hypothetical protein
LKRVAAAHRDLERGVGPTMSSELFCASLIAAVRTAGFAMRRIAPGGSQRVEWADDNVYLTGWAEVVHGQWRRQIPRRLTVSD